MPSVKENQIISAAADLFARYGFGKTTMGDIAAQAGVARATVYNAFENKDQILRGVIQMLGVRVLDDVTDAWGNQGDLCDKLELFCNECPLHWYDVINASPDMAEVLDGANNATKCEVALLSALWIDAFEAMLVPHVAANTATRPLADFIYSNAMNAKHNAPDRETLVQRLTLLRQSVLALITTQ